MDSILDQSLTLLQSGQATLDECLARYSDQAAELRPLLEMAIEIRYLPLPLSSPSAFETGKRRMLQALARKKRRQAAPTRLPPRVARWIATPFGGGERPTVRKRVPAFQLAMATAMVLVLLVAGGLLFQSWQGGVVAQTVTLTNVSGVVQVLPSGSNAWQPAVTGRVIVAGDRIRTGESSSVALSFFDGSKTSLEARTELTVSELSSQRDGSGKVIILHQWTGQTSNCVERLADSASRFEIKTAAAATAARGTEFVIAVEADGTTEVAVIEGYVEVMAQGITVVVQAGQGTMVLPEQPPASVYSLPAAATPTMTTTATCTPTLTVIPSPTGTPQPPGQTNTPQPPGQTNTPQPPGQTKTPQPPGQTNTPQPPGQTNTP
ncbi:MAG: FecR domain-containing protein, partial [Chloroflexota bacterium]|nr:FecR domain-containing protein [Chloroflexota bacterium]